MKEEGLLVEAHGDHFADNAPDEEWIAEVSKRGWVAISHDKGIRRKPNERAAVFASRLRLIIVIGKMPFPEVARYFARSKAAITRFVARNDGPWIARFYPPSPAERSRKVDPPGQIELWLREGDR